MGATMKMAAGGKEAKKKDLGAIAMMIKNCYVASVTRVADVNQTVKAFKEAEAYKGPSIVIVYAACVDWGAGPATRPGCGSWEAADSCYWPMYRYNPASVGQPVKLALELDPKLIDSTVTEAMMADEYRFASLQRSAPDPAKLPQASMTENNATCHEARRRQPMTARAGWNTLGRPWGAGGRRPGDGAMRQRHGERRGRDRALPARAEAQRHEGHGHGLGGQGYGLQRGGR